MEYNKNKLTEINEPSSKSTAAHNTEDELSIMELIDGPKTEPVDDNYEVQDDAQVEELIAEDHTPDEVKVEGGPVEEMQSFSIDL